MKTLALSAALLGAAALPAAAGSPAPVPAEPVVVQPAPVAIATRDWTGPYVGAQLGYGSFDAEGAGVDASDDGAVGGLHAGYNRDFGNFILGGEIDWDATGIEDTVGGADGSLDSVGHARLRMGPDMGRTFPYVTAGAAWADAEVDGDSYSDTGWVAGVGMDYQLNDNWVVGGDILYNQFDDFDDTGVDLSGTTARVRVSFRF